MLLTFLNIHDNKVDYQVISICMIPDITSLVT
jgi:hypothetical protein